MRGEPGRASLVEGAAPAEEPLNVQVQRMWVIAAAAKIVHELGAGELHLQDVAHRAGVGQGTVSAMFADREELLLATFRTACALAAERTIPFYAAEIGPVQRIRVGLSQLLVFHEDEPELSSVCLSDEGGLAPGRARVVSVLARVVLEELDSCFPGPVPPGEVEAAIARALELVRTAGSASSRTLLVALLETILTPHLGAAPARIEAALPAPEAATAQPRRLYPDGRASLDLRLTAHLLSRRADSMPWAPAGPHDC